MSTPAVVEEQIDLPDFRDVFKNHPSNVFAPIAPLSPKPAEMDSGSFSPQPEFPADI